MALLHAGYWPTRYWPGGYWEEDYWPNFGAATLSAKLKRGTKGIMEFFEEEEPLIDRRIREEEEIVILA